MGLGCDGEYAAVVDVPPHCIFASSSVFPHPVLLEGCFCHSSAVILALFILLLLVCIVTTCVFTLLHEHVDTAHTLLANSTDLYRW